MTLQRDSPSAPLRTLALVATLAGTTPAMAAPWFATTAAGGSDDSDDFRIRNLSLGAGRYLSEENFVDRLAFRHGKHRFRAPGFELDGRSNALYGGLALGGSMTANAEIRDFRGGDFHATLGEANWIGDFSGDLHLEFGWEKNLVESANALSSGITYDAITVAADKTFADRLNIALVAGQLDFSDGNERPLLRARISYRLLADQGIHLYAKTRRYANSQPFTGNYFSPDRLRDELAGVSFRQSLPALASVLSGWADWGRQTVDGTATDVHTWQLKLEGYPRRPWHYAFALGYQTTAGVSGGPNYGYRYLQASAIIPF